MHRRLSKLIHQHLGQAFVGFMLGDLYIASGKVFEDRFENFADRQRAGLRRQITAPRGCAADRPGVGRLMPVEPGSGLRRHPYRGLWR